MVDKNLLNQIIQLRQGKQYTQAEKLLDQLLIKNPDDALLNYHFAWLCDAQAKERQAVSYYEKAIANGLADDDLRGALLGLGSTYRTLGEYENSRRILELGCEKFPEANEFRVFMAMTHYNLGDAKEAVSNLLFLLLETTSDDQILRFKSAIKRYAEDLDQTWE